MTDLDQKKKSLNWKFVGSFNGAITIYNNQFEQNNQIEENKRLEHANELKHAQSRKNSNCNMNQKKERGGHSCNNYGLYNFKNQMFGLELKFINLRIECFDLYKQCQELCRLENSCKKLEEVLLCSLIVPSLNIMSKKFCNDKILSSLNFFIQNTLYI